tara:strand:+ start:332 stop:556 length:225 start_codon:yes stop_codon:yes gene_type:complete
MVNQKANLFVKRLSDELDFEKLPTLDSSLDDLGWDSLAIITTIAIFDELFEITLDVEKLKNCKTLKDVLQLSES